MSVDIVNLQKCILECDRFFQRANTCLDNLKMAKQVNGWPDNRLTAAVRRSSMDLTRALAALRDYRR